MSERDGYQPGVPCWVDTWQADADAAVSFYAALFRWDHEDTMPPGIFGRHFMCRLRGRDVAAVASRPTAAPPVSAWNTYVWVDDAAATAARAVPGFVGGEPQQPVPRDVVAAMATMTSEQFPAEVPSHWRPDFWVADADATADEAARRDGKVLAPPYDVPGAPLRQGVLADPEGAPFSVTQLTVGGPPE